MRHETVTITLDDDVEHFDRVIRLAVMGDARPLAEALQKGDFKVSYTITNHAETLVELP